MSNNCNNCVREAVSNDKELTTVTMSSADWQKNEQRHERREVRHIWIIVLLIVLFVGSNIGWLIYESSFEKVETVIEAEQGDGINIVGGGDVNYGSEG